MTRSVTSDLSRNDPLTSSEKRRRSTVKGSAASRAPIDVGFSSGDGLTLTLRYRRRAFLAAIAYVAEEDERQQP